MGARQQFSLVLIKPSHYDDDGYVIQWFRSAIPSNSLAVVHGLMKDCKERRVLGEDVDIHITSMDEDNTRVRAKRIARQLAGRRGLVVLVGVQSNQFPRAMDIARPLRAAGVPACGACLSASRALIRKACSACARSRTKSRSTAKCCCNGSAPA